jgi:hypothetical protein
MYPAQQQHNACLGPGFVSAGSLPLEAAAAQHRAKAGTCVLQPTAGGPAMSVVPSDPNQHTQCVAVAALEAGVEAQPLSIDRARLPVCPDAAAWCPHLDASRYPYVTGTSVLAVKYADGVMLACDTLGACSAALCSTKRHVQPADSPPSPGGDTQAHTGPRSATSPWSASRQVAGTGRRVCPAVPNSPRSRFASRSRSGGERLRAAGRQRRDE